MKTLKAGSVVVLIGKQIKSFCKRYFVPQQTYADWNHYI